MKKILVLLLVGLLGNCTNTPDTFATFDIDPIRTSLKNQKIRNYEEFIVISDSIIRTYRYQVDSNGNILTQDAFPGVLNGNHNRFQYDSLGRLTRATYERDVLVEYIVDYELLPQEQTVKQFWRESDALWSTLISKYDDALKQILEQ